jgi:ribonuclease Z
MSADLRFVAVPTADTPGTLLTLNFEDKRYLFGRVAEGTQRICLQKGLNLVKTRALFLSGNVGWGNTGGLTGLALTLADSLKAQSKAFEEAGREVAAGEGGEEGLKVYGGDGLYYSVATGRKYILRVGGHVKFQEFDELNNDEPDFKDHNVQIWTIKVNPTGYNQKSSDGKSADDIANERATIRQSLVSLVKEMWESEWRLDNLVIKELQDVEGPVTAIWIRDPVTKDLTPYKGPIPDGKTELADPTMKVAVRRPWPAAIQGDIPPLQTDHEAVSYLIKTYPRRGKFLAAKAKALKVKPGPKYAELTAGRSVLNENGETITSEMVLEPARPGLGFFVIDVPSIDYVDNLINRPEWNDEVKMQGAEFMIWILGPGVSSSPAITTFMEKMKHLKHIVSSTDHCPNVIQQESSNRLTALLHSVHPVNFVLPLSDSERIPQQYFSVGEPNKVPKLPENASPATTLLNIGLRPQFKIQEDTPQPFRDLEVSEEVLEHVESAKARNHDNRELFATWRSTLNLPDTEVVCLGTGSAIPSLTRNVTGILLRVPGHGNYILDCGENTIGQLKRMYPHDELVEILRDLRMIWISHIHADHHLGTIGLIKAWYEATHQNYPLLPPEDGNDLRRQLNIYAGSRKRLPVVATIPFHQSIAEFSKLDEFGYSRVLPITHWPAEVDIQNRTVDKPTTLILMASLLTGNKDTKDIILTPDLKSHVFGALDIQTVPVKHCRDAAGLALTFNPISTSPSSSEPAKTTNNSFRVAWSGDCRPSAKLAVIGENADLLIHEATFGAGFEGQAMAKAHSTMREAKRVAEAMGAKSLLLTHFSQRYSKLPDMKGLVAGELQGKDAAYAEIAGLEVVEASIAVEEEGEGEALIEEDIAAVAHEDAMVGVEQSGPLTAVGTNNQIDMAKIRPSFEPSQIPVCAAFDFMRIRVGDIPLMDAYIPALVSLFEKAEVTSSPPAFDAEPEVHPKKKKYDETKVDRKKRKREEYAATNEAGQSTAAATVVETRISESTT